MQQDDAVIQLGRPSSERFRDEIGAQDNRGSNCMPSTTSVFAPGPCFFFFFLDGDHALIADLGRNSHRRSGGRWRPLRWRKWRRPSRSRRCRNRSGHGLDLGHDRGDGLVPIRAWDPSGFSCRRRRTFMPPGQIRMARTVACRWCRRPPRHWLRARTSFDHLRAHVLEKVRKLDFPGDGSRRLGDARRPPGFVD